MDGWVFYDADCSMCTRMVNWISPFLAKHHFALAPLQENWVRTRLALPEEELLNEMRVLRPNGKIIGGADAIIYLMSHIAWMKPFALLAKCPGVMPVLRIAYRWVAESRKCKSKSC
jgi:predicted DCC family thiol-disulfide oxidoreductase YuxK